VLPERMATLQQTVEGVVDRIGALRPHHHALSLCLCFFVSLCLCLSVSLSVSLRRCVAASLCLYRFVYLSKPLDETAF
jgi:hypothetical protein